MDASRPESIILTGSRKKEILEWIDDRIPFPCLMYENPEKYDNSGRMFLVLFCPGDNQELEKMYQKVGRSLLSSGVPAAVVLSFPPDFGTGFPVFLNKSDFAFRILSRMACYAGVLAGEAVNLNCILWERTGSLLPFFIHNMNNILARIMGNIELAGFHSGQTDKVKEKLSIALEGTEELRNFLERLSVYSTADDDDSEWSLGNEADVLELSQMSSGTSDKFTYEEKSGMPRKLHVRKNLMNLLTGLIAASATISVNGCGSVEMSASLQGEAAEFKVNWNSTSKSSGLCPNSMDSAADLLTRAAMLASHSALSFRLNVWNRDGGSASLLVPVNDENL